MADLMADVADLCLQIDENEEERKEGAAALVRSPVLRKNFLTLGFAW